MKLNDLLLLGYAFFILKKNQFFIKRVRSVGSMKMYHVVFKRILDLTFSGMLIIFIAPLLFIVGIIVKQKMMVLFFINRLGLVNMEKLSKY